MELYEYAEQYDIEYEDFKDDIPYYLRKLPSPSKACSVLELACGTGRVTLELAMLGYGMTGVDLSLEMLETARKKAGESGLSVDWVLGDIRNLLDLPALRGKVFDAVIFPFNSLCHLHSRQDAEACLKGIKGLLKPEGLFILDIVNPSYEILTCDPEENPVVAEYPVEDGTGMVVIRERAVYRQADQVKDIFWTYWAGGELLRTAHLEMRLYYPREIEALLHYNGFGIIEIEGDYSGNPFADDSPRRMLVCRSL